jgi:hypothetical protein
MSEQIPQQPPVPESKYAPLNLAEFKELKEHLEGIKAFLPEHLMSTLWEKCNRIRGERIQQPCSCKSSAGLWGRCVDELRQFVRDRDAQ